jgi:hypothetical protein
MRGLGQRLSTSFLLKVYFLSPQGEGIIQGIERRELPTGVAAFWSARATLPHTSSYPDS